MTDTKCEPPEELRGVVGWHWVEYPIGAQVCVCWGQTRTGWGWADLSNHAANTVRYLAPVATPAEVEALRRDLAFAKAGEETANRCLRSSMQHRRELADANTTLRRERDEARAEVAGLREVLRWLSIDSVDPDSRRIALAALAKEAGT